MSYRQSELETELGVVETEDLAETEGAQDSCTRVYRYGAIPPEGGARASFQGQFELAHRYHNDLVALERQRRNSVAAAIRSIDPKIDQIEMRLEGFKTIINILEASANKTRVTTRSKRVKSTNSSWIKRFRALKKAAYADLKTYKMAIFGKRQKEKDSGKGWQKVKGKKNSPEWLILPSAAWVTENARMNKDDHDNRLTLRAKYSDLGLVHGAYLAVEDAAKKMRSGKPPKFRPWRYRKDHSGVQLQGGCLVPDLLTSNDTRVQMDLIERVRKCDGCLATARLSKRNQIGDKPCTCAQLPPPSVRHGRHALLRLRVGSTGPRNRTPIWGEVRINYHQDLPPDARIMRAYLNRANSGRHDVWYVTFTVQIPEESVARPRAKEGSVGIDFGWRREADGALTIATWYDSLGGSGSYRLPTTWVAEMKKVNDIQSIRDKLFDKMKEHVKDWQDSLDPVTRFELPGYWHEAFRTIHLWRSQARLAACVIKDQHRYPVMEEWRRRDAHLLDYRSHLRAQLRAARKNGYRVFADWLAKTYAHVVYEDIRTADIAELPNVEDGVSEAHDRINAYRTYAAVGEMKEAIKHRISDAISVPPKNTTRQCPWCRQIGGDPEDSTSLKCPNYTCSRVRHRDIGAAYNALCASGHVLQPIGDLLEIDSVRSCVVAKPANRTRALKQSEALEMRTVNYEMTVV